MNRPEPDHDLVRRAASGDQQAFAQLVHRHQDRVYRLCLRIMGNADDAHDAAQDTFLSLFRKLDQFRGDAAFTTWLHRVGVNACYDSLRRKKRAPLLRAVDDDGRPQEQGPATVDHADEVVGTLDVARALAQIREDYRVVLVLADIQDLAYDQIAEILEVPVGTVKSRVHRGRLALAKALGIGGQDDPPSTEWEPGPSVDASEDSP
ncbi:MAG TPA: sigma-70 family RNA polymerase sigma factor [Actinomycetota bacterium]